MSGLLKKSYFPRRFGSGKDIICASTTSNIAYVDLVNISGKGYLMSASGAKSGTAASSEVQIVVDGTQIFSGNLSFGTATLFAMIMKRFETSLIVRFRSEVSGQEVAVMASYILD